MFKILLTLLLGSLYTHAANTNSTIQLNRSSNTPVGSNSGRISNNNGGPDLFNNNNDNTQINQGFYQGIRPYVYGYNTGIQPYSYSYTYPDPGSNNSQPIITFGQGPNFNGQPPFIFDNNGLPNLGGNYGNLGFDGPTTNLFGARTDNLQFPMNPFNDNSNTVNDFGFGGNTGNNDFDFGNSGNNNNLPIPNLGNNNNDYGFGNGNNNEFDFDGGSGSNNEFNLEIPSSSNNIFFGQPFSEQINNNEFKDNSDSFNPVNPINDLLTRLKRSVINDTTKSTLNTTILGLPSEIRLHDIEPQESLIDNQIGRDPDFPHIDPNSPYGMLNLDPNYQNPNQGVYTNYPDYRVH